MACDFKKTRNNLSYVNPVNFSGPSCEQEQFWVRWIVEFLIEGYKISPIFIQKNECTESIFCTLKTDICSMGPTKAGHNQRKQSTFKFKHF